MLLAWDGGGGGGGGANSHEVRWYGWPWWIVGKGEAGSLLGDSGGVVNSLDFCPASLKSLGCFYFRCVLRNGRR